MWARSSASQQPRAPLTTSSAAQRASRMRGARRAATSLAEKLLQAFRARWDARCLKHTGCCRAQGRKPGAAVPTPRACPNRHHPDTHICTTLHLSAACPPDSSRGRQAGGCCSRVHAARWLPKPLLRSRCRLRRRGSRHRAGMARPPGRQQPSKGCASSQQPTTWLQNPSAWRGGARNGTSRKPPSPMAAHPSRCCSPCTHHLQRMPSRPAAAVLQWSPSLQLPPARLYLW